MQIYLKEKIGLPELFTGRKKEMAYFERWINRIESELSMSQALLSRRKTGKSAILQRLYNKTFDQNGMVVPFYFEIQESPMWLLDFSQEFLLAFVSQYLAFKTRQADYVDNPFTNFDEARRAIEQTDFTALLGTIDSAVKAKAEKSPTMWDIARNAPRRIAALNNERVVQFVDEFQHLSRYIYRDRDCTIRLSELPGTYLHTAEYKHAPLLVSGSWVGWLMDDLIRLLPGRFQFVPLQDMPEDESVEMIFKYAHTEELPITDEVAYIMADLTEGNPFYISALFRSIYFEKDFTTLEGLNETLEFETTNRQGMIRGTWMEYVASALHRINDQNAKNIVLYLCQHRDREVGRKELLEKLTLEMTDAELNKRLLALAYSDIIEYGRSNFYYRGVQDNIFDKVFRSQYADDIQEFDPAEIGRDYRVLLKAAQKKYRQLSGEYGHFKGKFAEYVVINKLQYQVWKYQTRYLGMMENLPDRFQFSQYKSVWSYSASPVQQRSIQIDVLARTKSDEPCLIGEVKNRATTKFTLEEATHFHEKSDKVMELEQIKSAVLFVICTAGFPPETLDFFRQYDIAWSTDARWFEQ